MVDYVIVHVGYAIQRSGGGVWGPEEAATVWEIYDEMLALESSRPLPDQPAAADFCALYPL